ncbi:IS66 family transposase [Sulfitobacter pacificus]|uniref:Transposase n=1 Tax=Sulfitobacter pacificus TaxID=1499314 RepID=A0ABQ5VCK9_9RHOB|nr:IS66 family transposase [Sulfitobacter pacificus]GLQ25200.1 transposase [Sulfitobacter pacificus]
MEEIQSTCAMLARHPEEFVVQNVKLIANADFRRDVEHDNAIAARDASISTLTAKLKVTRSDNRWLRAKLNKLTDMQFGQSSEKGAGSSQKKGGEQEPNAGGGNNEGGRGDSGGKTDDDAEPPKKPRGMKGKQAVVIPNYLSREDPRVIEPETGEICSCGCQMRPMGEQIIERLTFRPAQVRVIKEIYPKYVCRTCDRFVQAKVPPREFDYTKFDDRLIAGLAVSKFADFLPLYRQEQIFKRSGVKIHRSTMVRLMDQLCNALEPVHQALEADLKSSTKLSMDETVLSQLMPDNGKTKTCYVWALCRDDRRWAGNAPPGVVFHFMQSRKGEHAEEILQGFSGNLQVDGYAGYRRLMSPDRPGGQIKLAYCWAHVRRKFIDVVKATKSKRAEEIIDLINTIYTIEKKIAGMPSVVRLAVRDEEAKPTIDQLFQLLVETSKSISMKSSLGAAITYTMKLREGLTVFLEDGRVEFDNNAVENTIRPIALLRKNALFAGSEIGGRNWAIMASIIGTCRMNGIEPYAYLIWLLGRMAAGHPRSEYDKLLPWHCPKGRHGIE